MKCAVFIDGSNVFYSAQHLGVRLDYTKLLEVLVGAERELLRAFFYTGEKEYDEKQQKFLLWMRRNGFRVISKPLVERDGVRKADLDVNIATDMMIIGNKVDTIILVSGDEHFAYPLSVLAQRGIRIEVAGFRHSSANRLKDCADRYIDLDSLLDRFTKATIYDEEDTDDRLV